MKGYCKSLMYPEALFPRSFLVVLISKTKISEIIQSFIPMYMYYLRRNLFSQQNNNQDLRKNKGFVNK